MVGNNRTLRLDGLPALFPEIRFEGGYDPGKGLPLVFLNGSPGHTINTAHSFTPLHVTNELYFQHIQAHKGISDQDHGIFVKGLKVYRSET
jgi:hypothetical protein